jgi:sarcosine oxidase
VVTAGAWTGQLIPSLSHLLQPERQVLGWFQPISPEKFLPENFPVFVAEVKEGHFYGFPTYEIPGFKIGKFNHQHETGKPEDLDSEPDTTDESILRDFVKRYFPEANGPVMRLSTCMFTNTPDEAFLLDTLPQSDRVVIGAGFSGHGFKFASVIGEILADLAIDAQTTHPIDFLQLDRFE